MKLNVLLYIAFFNSACFAVSISDVITKAATYNYRVAIPAKPVDVNDAIITIGSSHVVLDLEGGCLSQDSSNTVTGLTGIVVESNLTDIEIKNGNIADLTGYGIYVKDGSSNIRIKNMQISGCQKGGIFFEGDRVNGNGIGGVLIDKSLVTRCTGFDGSSAFGIKLVNTTEVFMQECFLLHNDAGLVGSGVGLEIVGCSFVKCFDCCCDANGGNAFAAGVSIMLSTSCLFSDCIAASNIARSSESSSLSAGFYLNQCNKITLSRCRGSSNQNIGKKAVGFYSQLGTRNVIQYCESEGNIGATEACGFQLHNSQRANIIHSECTLNETTNSGSAYGILLSGNNDRCDIDDNYVAYTKGKDSSFGIVDQRSSSTSLFIRNKAFDNGTNFSISYPLGISVPRLQGSLSNMLIGLPEGSGGILANIDVNP